MGDKRLEVGNYTIIGDRAYQQDLGASEWSPNNMLFASVCDGMGGMTGGELASLTGISTFLQMFRESPPASIAEAPAWMNRAFISADQKVAALVNEDGSPMHSGSTAIIVMVENDKMQWGCVGDSRIYMLRDGQLRTITRMHNYFLQLDEMRRLGQIDQNGYKEESVRGEALISFLGVGGLPLIDTGRDPIQLMARDIIILCSDGLYKALDDQQIQAIIEESGENMKIAAERLCNEAYRLAVKKQDNTTVIAVRYAG